MSPTGIAFILLMIVMSGVLAYYGDIIGRKIGKRRHTIKRLRPRHTAALFTALFGMLASAMTITLLLWLSTPVRVMLLEGDRLKGEINALKERNRLANESLGARQKELEETRGEVQTERKKVQDEQKRLATTRTELTRLKNASTALKRQAQLVRVQLAQVKAQFNSLKPQYDRLQADVGKLTTQKTYAQTQYAEIQKQNLDLVQKVDSLKRQAETLKGDIERQKADIEDLKKTKTQAQEAFDTQLLQYQRELKSLQTDVDDANSELARTRQVLSAFISGPGNASRVLPIVFSRGDELTRIPVGRNLSLAEAKNYVLAGLEASANQAEARGAKGGVEGQRAAFLRELRDTKHERTISAEEQIAALAQRLAGKNTEQVLLYSALFNSFKDEAVLLNVQIVLNPVVYKANEMIIETRIDGQRSEEEIVSVLTDFIQNQLGPKAIKDGIIPEQGKAAPLGEIPPDDLLTLVRQIKGSNRVIRVQFLSLVEARAADKLKLEFRLR
ncbi:MAG: DUF3084 domain-containing protein [Armatimonadetes bacterium]|nr:DUF3084 domain-containing protein [Armatimonadota bacterium]